MAVGGFTGTDPTPTLAQFIDDIANSGDVLHRPDQSRRPPANVGTRAGGGAANAGRADNRRSEIADWVIARFPAETVGSATVYDLSGYSG